VHIAAGVTGGYHPVGANLVPGANNLVLANPTLFKVAGPFKQITQ
jgi:hypothetical protein